MQESVAILIPTAKEVSAVLRRPVRELPALPMVALKLLRITGDESANGTVLGRIVETDPAIAARVLRRVNSAHYAFQHKISSIPHAVVILGFSAIRAIAMEVALFDAWVRRDVQRKFDRARFWQHSLAVAGLCRVLARVLNHPDPEEAYAAGLLHDIGKLIIDVHGTMSYRDFLESYRRTEEGPLVEEEKVLIGLSHDRLGGYFAHQWRLPDAIVNAILLHHQSFAHLDLDERDKLLVAIVAFSGFLAWTQGLGSVQVAVQPVLHPDIDGFIPLSDLDLGQLLETMAEEVKGVAQFYDFTFPMAEIFRVNLLQTNIRLSRLNSRQYERQVVIREKLQVLHRLQARLTSPTPGLVQEELVAQTLAAIQQDLQFDHIYLMGIDSHHRSLQIQGCWPSEGKDGLIGLRFPITNQSGGILACLRERKPVLLNAAAVGDQAMLRQLGVVELALLPMSAHGRIVGAMAVDNRVCGRALVHADLALLGIVANELGLALQHARTVAALTEKAEIDGLTRIFNRGALESRLQQAFRSCRQSGFPMALGIVDVDFFKKFNDTYGHQAGDSILRLLAGAMQKLCRPTDLVGRLGGEEFVFLLHHMAPSGAFTFAERLRGEIEGLGKTLLRRYPRCTLTVSIGVATLTSEVACIEELLNHADDALYHAKNSGRNRVQAWDGNAFFPAALGMGKVVAR